MKGHADPRSLTPMIAVLTCAAANVFSFYIMEKVMDDDIVKEVTIMMSLFYWRASHLLSNPRRAKGVEKES